MESRICPASLSGQRKKWLVARYTGETGDCEGAVSCGCKSVARAEGRRSGVGGPGNCRMVGSAIPLELEEADGFHQLQ